MLKTGRFLALLFVISVLWGASIVRAEDSENSRPIYSQNCELFIDKILARQGSHGRRALTVYLKTLNSRIYGNIKRLGIYHRTWQKDRNGSYNQLIEDWHFNYADSFSEASDYWSIEFPIDHSFKQSNRYEGVLFAETDKNVRYWLNSASGNSHYIFDEDTFKTVQDFMGGVPVYDENPMKGVPTQTLLRYYNHNGCY